jgi:hypothetical protein
MQFLNSLGAKLRANAPILGCFRTLEKPMITNITAIAVDGLEVIISYRNA